MPLPDLNTSLYWDQKYREYDYLRGEVKDSTDKTVDRMVKNPGDNRFLGVIVLYRNGLNQLKHLKTYFNTELGLHLDSTVGNLKNAILERSDELQVECSPFSLPKITEKRINIRNALGSQIPSKDLPSFVVQQMYFGTPAGIKDGFAIDDYPGDIHGDIPYRIDHRAKPFFYIYNYSYAYDNTTLKEIYKEYISRVKTQIEFSNVIPVKNESGESKYRVYDSLNEVLKVEKGKNPIAWMIVEIGCEYINKNTSSSISTIRSTDTIAKIRSNLGRGKTRRNKLRRNKLQRKRNKSQRRNRM